MVPPSMIILVSVVSRLGKGRAPHRPDDCASFINSGWSPSAALILRPMWK
jgi:hypothetical protein